MGTRVFGPFPVRKNPSSPQSPTETEIFVKAGDRLRITVPRNDRIHFGGFLGTAGDASADGRAGEIVGSDFPGSGLTRFSLICRVGSGPWMQAGTDRTVTAPVEGRVTLHVNDNLHNDNAGVWNVTLARTTPNAIDDLPRFGSGALFQATDGNFKLVAVGNLGRSIGAGEGDLVVFERDSRFAWRRGRTLSAFENHSTVLHADRVARFPSWFEASDGNFWCVYRQGTQAKCIGIRRDLSRRTASSVTDVPGASDCGGPPSMIQSRYGRRGNFELVYPTTDGRMKARYAKTDEIPPTLWENTPIPWSPDTAIFGEPGFRVLSVRLMQSSFGNLELIALEQVTSGAVRLRHWFRHDWPSDAQGRQFQWIPGAVLPDSQRVVPNSIPAFIQSTFRSAGDHGNFEVGAPAVDGGFLHWFFDHSRRGDGWRTAPQIDRGGRRLRAVHMIQGPFGARGNFEVVGETGEPVTLNNPAGVGFGNLLFYWRNNDSGTWSAPAQFA
jgi:hypothetical protein